MVLAQTPKDQPKADYIVAVSVAVIVAEFAAVIVAVCVAVLEI